MIGTNTTVTDKEIDEYLQANKDQLPPEQDVNDKQLRENVKQQLQSQKMEEKYQKFITDLRKNSQVRYF